LGKKRVDLLSFPCFKGNIFTKGDFPDGF